MVYSTMSLTDKNDIVVARHQYGGEYLGNSDCLLLMSPGRIWCSNHVNYLTDYFGMKTLTPNAIIGDSILARLTPNLDLAWLIPTDWHAVAVGIDRIYSVTIYNSMSSENLFTVRRLEDGKKLFRTLLSGPFPSGAAISYPSKAVLTGDNRFLIIISARYLVVIEVSSGMMIPIIDSGFMDNATEISVFPQPSSADFKITFHDIFEEKYCIYDCTFRPEQQNYAFSSTFTVSISRGLTPIGFDLRNNIFFRQVKSKGSDDWEFETHKVQRKPRARRELVTVPNKDNGRIALVAPRRNGPETRDFRHSIHDYLGITDGYLVYHNSLTLGLTVANFWPSW